MRASQLSVVARGWLEMKGLDHLLPDPHGHEHIQGLIATYYEGGCKAFLKDVDGLVEFGGPVPIAAATASTPPLLEPTWFRPPEAPITKTCERDWCGKEFSTTKVHQRYCSLGCQKNWRPLDRPAIDQLLGRAA